MSDCLVPSSCGNGNAVAAAPTAATFPVVRPRHNVRAVEGAYEVGVLMPGVKREAVTVRVEDDVLRVDGRRDVFSADGWRPLRRELGPVQYRLELELTVPVDASRISARLEDGVLSLRLPLREEAKAREIPIG